MLICMAHNLIHRLAVSIYLSLSLTLDKQRPKPHSPTHSSLIPIWEYLWVAKVRYDDATINLSQRTQQRRTTSIEHQHHSLIRPLSLARATTARAALKLLSPTSTHLIVSRHYSSIYTHTYQLSIVQR